ncbi:hypothetical protein MmiAt1_00220 [Methanimicrococcus sp. At1]|uniref:Uncharacterized protein n=1 Tax=Methanimicrococcus hacksteinii TaxID=3028293 RepID=A0ABU3VM62_9EURY|nr:hypothetical protein [Methanimicrococcus sp. At1]MDV0444496.1 hypothetical protein [Methanimicrococcus sp. At1]
MVLIYFVSVFYICFIISGTIAFIAVALFDIANPDLFVQALSIFILSALGGIDFYRSFKGKWSLVSFILSIPIMAGMLLKAILSGKNKIQFDVKPPQFNRLIREISKIRIQ